MLIALLFKVICFSTVLLIGMLAFYVFVYVRFFIKRHKTLKAFVAFWATEGSADQVYRSIEDAALPGASITVLRLDFASLINKPESMLQSRMHGTPYAEAGDEWPAQGAQFVVQILLTEPSLGLVWQGRLLVIFMTPEEVIVRCYASPRSEKFVRLASDQDQDNTGEWLISLRIPAEAIASGDYITWLWENVPQVREHFRGYDADGKVLLAMLLNPCTASTEPTDRLIYLGGEPMTALSSFKEPRCDKCDAPLRFLCHVSGEAIGFPRNICVFGCDAHPGVCKGYLDVESK